MECFIQQSRLISSRDNGPGVDTGDIFCEGYLCRAALLPRIAADPWDWLAAELPWQSPGLRASYTPPSTVQAPADGACWLGELADLSNPGALPAAPRAVLAGATLPMIGDAYGPGGIGTLVQPQLGERQTFQDLIRSLAALGPPRQAAAVFWFTAQSEQVRVAERWRD